MASANPPIGQGRALDSRHDRTLLRFLPALRALWQESVMPTLYPRSVRNLRAQADALFAPTSDTVRDAALIAAPRRVTPAAIRLVCKAGLDELLGSD